MQLGPDICTSAPVSKEQWLTAAAAVTSVVSDPVRPHRWQPTRLLRCWDSPGKNTGVGCHFLLQCMKVKSLSCVRPLATPWTAACQDPPSMGFSRQEYWSVTASKIYLILGKLELEITQDHILMKLSALMHM